MPPNLNLPLVFVIIFLIPLVPAGWFEMCTDSDGGSAYNVKGTVTATLDSDVSLFEDYCSAEPGNGGSTICPGDSCQYMVEVTCFDDPVDSLYNANHNKVDCVALGYTNCRDGACVNALANTDTCSDGTPEGSCSSNKPTYCDGGLLGARCELCGCPSGYECGTDQTCSISSSDSNEGSETPGTEDRVDDTETPERPDGPVSEENTETEGSETSGTEDRVDDTETPERPDGPAGEEEESGTRERVDYGDIPSPGTSSIPDEAGSCATGCLTDENTCIPIGVRTRRMFCDTSEELSPQLSGGEECYNNFECVSNLCVDSACTNMGLFQRFLSWFQRIFGGGEAREENVPVDDSDEEESDRTPPTPPASRPIRPSHPEGDPDAELHEVPQPNLPGDILEQIPRAMPVETFTIPVDGITTACLTTAGDTLPVIRDSPICAVTGPTSGRKLKVINGLGSGEDSTGYLYNNFLAHIYKYNNVEALWALGYGGFPEIISEADAVLLDSPSSTVSIAHIVPPGVVGHGDERIYDISNSEPGDITYDLLFVYDSWQESLSGGSWEHHGTHTMPGCDLNLYYKVKFIRIKHPDDKMVTVDLSRYLPDFSFYPDHCPEETSSPGSALESAGSA